MKCCIHHVLPSGHVIPFCAYNVLYREGHVVLPALRDAGARRADAIDAGWTLTSSRRRRMTWAYPLIMIACRWRPASSLEPADAARRWA